MSEPTIPYATPVRGGTPARDVFGVIVRTVGLLLTLWGVYAAAYAVIVEVFNAYPPDGQPKESFVVFAAVWIMLGVALVKGEWLVRFAYGPPGP